MKLANFRGGLLDGILVGAYIGRRSLFPLRRGAGAGMALAVLTRDLTVEENLLSTLWTLCAMHPCGHSAFVIDIA